MFQPILQWEIQNPAMACGMISRRRYDKVILYIVLSRSLNIVIGFGEVGWYRRREGKREEGRMKTRGRQMGNNFSRGGEKLALVQRPGPRHFPALTEGGQCSRFWVKTATTARSSHSEVSHTLRRDTMGYGGDSVMFFGSCI